MKSSTWDKELGLASSLSKKEAGLDASRHSRVSMEGREKNFFLTSFLIG